MLEDKPFHSRSTLDKKLKLKASIRGEVGINFLLWPLFSILHGVTQSDRATSAILCKILTVIVHFTLLVDYSTAVEITSAYTTVTIIVRHEMESPSSSLLILLAVCGDQTNAACSMIDSIYIL